MTSVLFIWLKTCPQEKLQELNFWRLIAFYLFLNERGVSVFCSLRTAYGTMELVKKWIFKDFGLITFINEGDLIVILIVSFIWRMLCRLLIVRPDPKSGGKGHLILGCCCEWFYFGLLIIFKATENIEILEICVCNFGCLLSGYRCTNVEKDLFLGLLFLES